MSYLGSKGQAGVYQRIIGNMPPHSVYVEPFFGSGKVFWSKALAARNVIIDADAGVIASFNAADPIANSGAAGLETDLAAPAVARAATTAICGDAIALLPTLALPADALVYCDPPYLHSTRTSRHRYIHELTDADHVRLLNVLKRLGCRVMLSGYPSKIYTQQLQGWRCCSYRTRTRGRTVTECLWCNFPLPTELHDWRFAGANFRERLKLKRMATRWLARLEAMPPIQRGYLLNAVHQRHSPRWLPAVNATNEH